MINNRDELKKELQLFRLPDYEDNIVYTEDVFNLIDKYAEEPTERNERAINTYYHGTNPLDLGVEE